MKEKLETKIEEIIENIVTKEPQDITYNEYRILDNKLMNIKFEEEQKRKNEDMAELMAKTFSSSFSCAPYPLPPEERED